MSKQLFAPGDVLIVTITPQQNGETRLTSVSTLSSDITNTTSFGCTIVRDFRIIEDDIFASDWMDFNKLKQRVIKSDMSIQVRYSRSGTNATTINEFKGITFDGDFTEIKEITPILDSSIFSDIAKDPKTEELAKNLFKKLYYRGIIANYVKRGDNVDRKEDEDYVNFSYTVAKFYAIVFRFFKRFETFFQDSELMREWVRQHGINFDESNTSIKDLQYISTHLLDEIRKRGTGMIFKYAGDTLTSSKKVELDGEFIRLIRGNKASELLYENMPLYKVGWCLGVSSPIYRGTAMAKNLNKTKENTKDFQNLNNFAHFNQNGFNSIGLKRFEDKQVLSVMLDTPTAAGLGRNPELGEINVDNLYVADPCMDYEITFMINTRHSNDVDITFGVEAFDNLFNKIESGAFIKSDYSIITDNFLQDTTQKFRTKHWYMVRGIIRAYSSVSIENDKLNIGWGNNLTFNNRFIKYILPKIYFTSNNPVHTEILLWDYKIRPLIRGTHLLDLKSGSKNSHSMGFIQAPKIFYAYFRNNNNSQSEDEIAEIIERYLLPFDMTNILQFINEN